VQNALFLLGGLLLGVAAIVFTAVAWNQFGVGGRAALLAGFTAAALAVPPLALRRSLSATAETFAAVGLLLMLLDGYAAWYVNLFGIDDNSPLLYAGAVCAVTAGVGAGYARLTGLIGPRFAALLVAQPVLPLLIAPLHPNPTGWSFTLAGVAALDLALIHLRRWNATPLGITTHILGLMSLVGSGAIALIALALAEHPATAAGDGAALVTSTLVLVAAAARTRLVPAQAVAGGLLVVALGIAGARFAFVIADHAAPVVATAVATTLALAVALAAHLRRPHQSPSATQPPAALPLDAQPSAALPLDAQPSAVLPSTVLPSGALPSGALPSGALPSSALPSGALPSTAWAPGAPPSGVWLGPWVGALAVIAVPALGAVSACLRAATQTIEAARPAMHAAIVAVPSDWRPAAALALVTAGLAALFPATWRPRVALIGVALTAFALPAAFGLPWWSASAIDLVVVAAALALALNYAASTKPAAADASTTDSGVAALGAAGSAAAASNTAGPGVAGHGLAGLGSGGAAAIPGAVPFGGPVGVPGVSKMVLPSVVAVVLAAHAIAVSLGRPAAAWPTFVVIALLGFATAALSATEKVSIDGVAAPTQDRRILGGFALVAGLLAIPAAAWTAAAALSLTAPVQSRAALVAAAAVVGAASLISRFRPQHRGYAFASALLAVVSAPLWALASGDSPTIYAGVGLALVAATLSTATTVRAVSAAIAAVPLGLAFLIAAGRSLLTLLVLPLGWGDRVWSGRPSGTGIAPSGWSHVAVADVVALVLVAVAAGIATWFLRGRRAAVWALAPVVAVALPMAFAAAGVPWPGVPAVSLLAGLAGLLTLALRPPHTSGTGGFGAAGTGAAGRVERSVTGGFDAGVVTVLALVSLALAWSGLAGALPTHASTLAAVGAVVVAGVVAGVAGRVLAVRIVGWLVAVAAALAFGYTAGRAFELARPTTAFIVLGAAAAALILGAVLVGRRPVEGRVVEAAAHAGAVLALLLAVEFARHAAVVCTVWGIALGLRALRPGERVGVRRGLVVAAAVAELLGWWLLIAGGQVSTLEAYTLPGALVALLAGWLATRSRPQLSSWVAYGPALAAALLPSLASVLVGDGQPERRLLLGLGALAVVVVGAYARMQAPVIVGGVVLAAVALHELVLVWDVLPRWIPLAAAGLLLVGLAMTLERRRRDLTRLRATLTRMS
jgi:hypothetical protein